MIHPSRLLNKRPPTVAEFAEHLKGCPQDALVVAIEHNMVLAPNPKSKIVYIDRNGQFHASKIDVIGPVKFVKVVAL